MDILSLEEIDTIWSNVQKLCWGNKLTPQQHYEMAQSTAEEKIAEKFDKLKTPKTDDDTSSGVLTDDILSPLSKERADFASYIDLFHGLVAQNVLEEIWQKIFDSSSSSAKDISSSSNSRLESQEKMEAAILNALNYLEEKDRVEALKRDDPTINIENSLTTYLSNQELQRCTSRSKKQSSASLSQAQREEALAYMLDLFSTASPALTQRQVTEELIKANYSIPLTIENICNSALKKGNYARELSYAEAVFTGKQLKQPNLPPAPPLSAHSRNHLSSSDPSNIYVVPAGKHPDRVVSSISSSYPDYYRRNAAFQQKQLLFAIHFLQVFQRKNPSIFISISEDGSFVYEGCQHERDCSPRDLHHTMAIRIDFHGLPVQNALQIVESSIDYYRSFGSGGSLGIARNVVLTYIVGLGLHSPGGVPKLRPAIEKYLQEEENRRLRYIVSGGEIMVTIPL